MTAELDPPTRTRYSASAVSGNNLQPYIDTRAAEGWKLIPPMVVVTKRISEVVPTEEAQPGYVVEEATAILVVMEREEAVVTEEAKTE